MPQLFKCFLNKLLSLTVDQNFGHHWQPSSKKDQQNNEDKQNENNDMQMFFLIVGYRETFVIEKELKHALLPQSDVLFQQTFWEV